MKLFELVTTSARLSETRSRLEKMELLGRLLVRASPDEVPLVVSYLSGRIPQGRSGIGHATVRSLGQLDGASEPSVLLFQVDETLSELASISGPGSSGRRFELLRELFGRATGEEQRFLARLLLGDLRQGSLEGVMAEAVARASGLDSRDVRRSMMLSGDLGEVAKAALTEGARGLSRFKIELFRPIQPMLAQTAEDLDEALETLGRCALEHKLDGARIQVHKLENEVRVFTRRLNDVTDACPEVVDAVRGLDATRLVLDGEAIALRKDGRPHSFQVTMRRFGRRLDVGALRRALPLSSFFFDCLFFAGESLIDAGAEERYRRLSQVVPEKLRVPRIVTSDHDEARAFARGTLTAGHEGIMAKDLGAPYEAGSRGKAWLKVKTAHTLDLVVLAAEWGSGRRRGWLSNLHLGARDPETGGFVMLGKTFKGMTDAVLEWQTQKLQELEVSRDEWTVYVGPELVVEIAFNDIQKSPHYPGGLALRFARLKSYREDKRACEADSIGTVRELYRRRTGDSADEQQLRLLPAE